LYGAGGDCRGKAFAAGNECTARRAAVGLLKANGIAVEPGAHPERAEERLFDYFRGRFSQACAREWFHDWMSPG